jgi:lipopolysaccharide transport system ATP-binding protein
MPVRTDAEIWLHIAADFKTLDPGLRIGYAIYAESGETLYRTYHTDAKQEEWPQLRLGRAILRTKIPPRLLNEGTYRLELVGQLHFRSWIFEPGADNPAVFLNVQGGLSDSPLWNERRPGFFAPVMGWEFSEPD